MFYEVVASSQDSYKIQDMLKECDYPCIEVLDEQYIMRCDSNARTISKEELKNCIENGNNNFERYVTRKTISTKEARLIAEKLPEVVLSHLRGYAMITYKNSLEDRVQEILSPRPHAVE